MPDTSLSAGFLAERPRLLSIAHRILGSIHDAEDAVQTAWLRMQTSSGVAIDSVPAWLTVSYTHLTLPTTLHECRSRWSPYH